ncbi:MAG: hypothetical protein MUE85_23315 [Microscillaceae bacterium]|jgi:signal transduction histidine kinase|nr:hypothetical protein [Microscillaceae bacterium]
MQNEDKKSDKIKNILGSEKVFKALGNLGLAVRGTAFALGAPTMMIAGSALGLASDVALKVTAQKNAQGDFDLMLSLVEINNAHLEVEQQFKELAINQNLQALKQKLHEEVSPEIKQERLRIAQLLKNDGISLDKICFYTGLTTEDLLKLI